MILSIDHLESFTWNLVHHFKEPGAKVLISNNDAVIVAARVASKPGFGE